MFEKLEQSSGNVLGYRLIGKIDKEDYAALNADMAAVLEHDDSVCLLLDMEALTGEAVSAWGADLKFGREYRKEIDRLAIVGNKKWQEVLAGLADPFYAREARFFPEDQREAAWEWCRQPLS